MKRLTEYTRFHGSMLPVMNNSNRYSAIERLAAIEDILGDDASASLPRLTGKAMRGAAGKTWDTGLVYRFLQSG